MTHTKPVAINPVVNLCRWERPVRPSTGDTPQAYRVSHEYINNSPDDLYLVDINNEVMILNKNTSGLRRGSGLTVVKHYEWDEVQVTFNVDHLYSEGVGSSLKHYVLEDVKNSNLYKDVFANMLVESTNGAALRRARRGSLTLNISDSLIYNNNKCVYIKELGVVVTTQDHVGYVLHPGSTEGIIKAQADAAENPVIFQLFANDPQRKEFSTRYININNGVYQVPVISNSALAPGVYATESLLSIRAEDNTSSIGLRRYDFDEADKALNLYKTHSDAKDHYGLETAQLAEQNINKTQEFATYQHKMKMEAEQAKQRFTEIKMEQELEYTRQTNMLKQEIDKLKAEADVRSAELKFQADRIDYRSMERKDNYESASYSRKGWGEIIKWIPGIVAGALTCVGIAFALFL